jgi:hypothetical protein
MKYIKWEIHYEIIAYNTRMIFRRKKMTSSHHSAGMFT